MGHGSGRMPAPDRVALPVAAHAAAPRPARGASRRAILRAGARAGLIAGAVLAVHLALIAETAAATTTDPGIRSSTWTPFTGLATILFGPGALHGSLWPGYVAAGLGLLLVYAAAAGVPGAWWVAFCLGRDRSPGTAMALGAAYGLALELVAVQFLLNPLQDPNVVYGSLPPWAWWAGHGVYGMVLGALVDRELGRAA